MMGTPANHRIKSRITTISVDQNPLNSEKPCQSVPLSLCLPPTAAAHHAVAPPISRIDAVRKASTTPIFLGRSAAAFNSSRDGVIRFSASACDMPVRAATSCARYVRSADETSPLPALLKSSLETSLRASAVCSDGVALLERNSKSVVAVTWSAAAAALPAAAPRPSTNGGHPACCQSRGDQH